MYKYHITPHDLSPVVPMAAAYIDASPVRNLANPAAGHIKEPASPSLLPVPLSRLGQPNPYCITSFFLEIIRSLTALSQTSIVFGMHSLGLSVVFAALAAFAPANAALPDNALDFHLALMSRQAPGTPAYDCHFNCGKEVFWHSCLLKELRIN
jgi:hypothetical protein